MTDIIVTYKDGVQKRFSCETYDMALGAFETLLNDDSVAEISIIKVE